MDREGIAIVPIWIKFPGLKLHLWSITMLSKLASVNGKPQHTDIMMAQRSRLAYARLCVEIGVGDPLPEVIHIKNPNGEVYV